MGQAFDRDGNVPGEAYGETKREVFEKLTGEFKDAHELRIKSADPRDEVGARPGTSRDRMLQFFTYAHLPPHLQEVSQPFCELAERMVVRLPMNPERTVMLRKLLEAKDCAVRALL